MNLEEGKLLVKLARNSIITFFSSKIIDLDSTNKFQEKQGVFVTLTKFSRLRGCIGFAEAVFPLQRAIIEASRAAAFEDPRFPNVLEKEMNEICVEVSVLTVPELIKADHPKQFFDMIEPGKHGLIIRKGIYSGLLLPQVFIDHDSTPKQALEMTCIKAGMDKDTWKEKDVQIFRFSAQIFKEVEPNGDIVEEEIKH